MTDTCETCEFFDGQRCRINPPIIVESGYAQGLWPSVTKFDWCGEWAEKTEVRDEREKYEAMF